ncbi:trypsin-like serine protease [Kitasatospora sp. NPDC002040]|uniref:trypsin-like serine protease n=1 Tax=Kitasatospora sp. NPDC002040 TaxID=3154661 RepID=UPI003322CEDD
MRAPRPWFSRSAGVLVTALTLGLLTGGAVGPANAVTGDVPMDDEYSFTAKLAIGDQGLSCSGVLIDPLWLLTARSCFADGTTPAAAGPPRLATTATVNRVDLADTASGRTLKVTTLAPHADRDLVLAKLEFPVFGANRIKLGSTAPAAGEILTVAGFGSTLSTAAPTKLRAGDFTVQSVDAGGIGISGSSPSYVSVCKGDAGGPAFRTVGGVPELVAISSTSHQKGCFGAPATTDNGAYEVRTDNLGSWIDGVVAPTRPLLAPGATLTAGQSLLGQDLKLTMLANGDLALTHRKVANGVLWSSGTGGNPGAYAVMQPDGNLVVYRSGGGPATGGALWSGNTSGNSGAYLALQDDGNLVLYRGDSAPGPAAGALWSTGTLRTGPAFPSGRTVWPRQWAEQGSTLLMLQQDGNLVLYRRSDGAALWASHTSGNPGTRLVMQTDGNLVLYPANGGPETGGALWNSGTYGNHGAHLRLQDDGNLVIYRQDGGQGIGGALWATSTFA